MSQSHSLDTNLFSSSGTFFPSKDGGVQESDSFEDWGWDLEDSDFCGTSPLDDVDHSDDLLDEAASQSVAPLFQIDRLTALDVAGARGVSSHVGHAQMQDIQEAAQSPRAGPNARKRSLSFLSLAEAREEQLNCSLCPCCGSECRESETSFLNHVKNCFISKNANLPPFQDTSRGTTHGPSAEQPRNHGRPRALSLPEMDFGDSSVPEDAKMIADLRSCLNRIDLRARIQVIESLGRISRLSSTKTKSKRRRCVLPAQVERETLPTMKEQDYKVLSMLLSASQSQDQESGAFNGVPPLETASGSPAQSPSLSPAESPVFFPIGKDPSMSFDCFFSQVSTPPLTSKSAFEPFHNTPPHRRHHVPKPRSLASEYLPPARTA